MSILRVLTDGDSGVTEFGSYDVCAMSSAWYSIIDEELHDDVDASLRAIRNVLSSSRGVSILLDSLRRTTAIVAGMPSGSRLGLVDAVVSGGEVEGITPLKGLKGSFTFLHLFEELDGFLEGRRAFIGHHTNLTRDSESFSLELPHSFLQVLNVLSGISADFVLYVEGIFLVLRD